jgi:predicted O-methyltransferase YrrM
MKELSMDIGRALQTEGWMSEAELEYLADLASRSGHIVEVGSWKGRSAIGMAMNTSAVVCCVDSWSGRLENSNVFYPDALKTFLANIDGINNILPVPLPSVRAAAVLQTYGLLFDLVFIDAAHDTTSVAIDIATWSKLLAPNGVLCGHDYGHSDWPGVKEAVDRFVPKFRIVKDTSIWTTEVNHESLPKTPDV